MRGIVDGRESGQQKNLVFCICWFGIILINQQQHMRGGKSHVVKTVRPLMSEVSDEVVTLLL